MSPSSTARRPRPRYSTRAGDVGLHVRRCAVPFPDRLRRENALPRSAGRPPGRFAARRSMVRAPGLGQLPRAAKSHLMRLRSLSPDESGSPPWAERRWAGLIRRCASRQGQPRRAKRSWFAARLERSANWVGTPAGEDERGVREHEAAGLQGPVAKESSTASTSGRARASPTVYEVVRTSPSCTRGRSSARAVSRARTCRTGPVIIAPDTSRSWTTSSSARSSGGGALHGQVAAVRAPRSSHARGVFPVRRGNRDEEAFITPPILDRGGRWSCAARAVARGPASRRAAEARIGRIALGRAPRSSRAIHGSSRSATGSAWSSRR